MRNLASICCIGTFALLTSACGNKDSGAASANPDPGKSVSKSSAASAAQSASAPATKPALYVSKEGRYEIDFGGATPKESVKDDPNGGTWNEAMSPSGTSMAQYTDYADHAHAVAETAGFIPTREKDKIKVDKTISVDGRDGRDIEMVLGSGKIFWIRFLIEGKRVYKIGSVYTPDKNRADAAAFIESLKITADPAAPAGSAAPGASSKPKAK